jgi:uncharacterized UPF0146 family protein
MNAGRQIDPIAQLLYSIRPSARLHSSPFNIPVVVQFDLSDVGRPGLESL